MFGLAFTVVLYPARRGNVNSNMKNVNGVKTGCFNSITVISVIKRLYLRLFAVIERGIDYFWESIFPSMREHATAM